MSENAALKKPLVAPMALGRFRVPGESPIRAYLRSNIAYDIEATRDALHRRDDSPNAGIGHAYRPIGSMRLIGVPVELNSTDLGTRGHPVGRGDAYRISFLDDSLPSKSSEVNLGDCGAPSEFLAQNAFGHFDLSGLFRDEENPIDLRASLDDARPSAFSHVEIDRGIRVQRG